MLYIRILTKDQYGIYDDIYPTKDRDKYHHRLYHARCTVCGTEVIKRLIDLKQDNTICTHKLIPLNMENKRISSIFSGMKARCYNKNDKAYRFYGAKGIKICDEWMNDPSKFEEWSLANGYDDTLTIDRKDSLKDYCPENCRWINNNTNAKYKSTTQILFVDNIGLSLRDWSTFLGQQNYYMSRYLKTHNAKEASHMIKKYIKKQGKKALIKLKQFSQYFIDLRDQYYVIEIKSPNDNMYITPELINTIEDNDETK